MSSFKTEKKTILIIDDNEQIVNTISRFLKALGWDIITARTGRKGQELLEKNVSKIAAILCDFTLNNFNIKYFFKRLKKNYPNIKRVIITGTAKDIVEETLSSELIDKILIKPNIYNPLKEYLKHYQ